MYKIFILILISSFFIVGCQGQKTANPDDVLKMTQRQERRIGVLQSLGGAYTSAQATHLLRMEDGTNIYLRSDYVKLEEEKYNNKQVEVMGEIIRTTDGKQLMDVNSIDVLDIESSTTDDLPQWMDYDSSELDLNLKYRDDYELTEKNNEITIVKSSKPTVSPESQVDEEDDDDSSSDLKHATISIKKLSGDPLDLATYMEVNSLTNSDILAGGFTRSKVTQKAIDAYKKSSSENLQIFYYLRTGSGIYAISFIAGDNQDDVVAEQNMFYDILASIDFHKLYEGGKTDETELSDGNEEISSDLDDSTLEDETSFEEPLEEDKEILEDSSITIESLGDEITGFTTFESESAGFTVQYPKSYYFGSTALSNNAYRSYEFGSEPLEESSGDIILDLVKGAVPEGKTSSFGGVAMTTIDNGNIISVYVQKDGEVYKVTGPSNKEKILKQMASTIENI